MSREVDAVLEADMIDEDHILMLTEDFSMIDSFIPDGMLDAENVDDENLETTDDTENNNEEED